MDDPLHRHCSGEIGPARYIRAPSRYKNRSVVSAYDGAVGLPAITARR